MNRFDPKTESFKHYSLQDKTTKNFKSSQILSLFIDSKNNFWVGTANSGLILLDRDSGIIKRYTHDKNNTNSLSSNTIKVITEDSLGNLWLGLSHAPLFHFPSAGLNMFSPSTEKVTRYLHDKKDNNTLANNHVSSIHIDQNGIVWIATYNAGLDRLEPSTNTFTHFWSKEKNTSTISPKAVLKIYPDKSANTLWLGTSENGLYEFDKKTGNFHPHLSSSQRKSVPSILIDDNILWAGTWRNGINKTNLASRQFSTLQNSSIDLPSLLNKKITSVYANGDNIWLANDEAGLVSIDKKTKAIKHFSVKQLFTNSKIDYLQGLFGDNKGDIWLSHPNAGLLRFNEKAPNSVVFSHTPGNKSSLSSNHITALAEDSKGNFWLGTLNSGLNYLNTKTGHVARYQHDKKQAKSLSYNAITKNGLIIDEQDNLWVATSGGGLNYLPAGQHKFRHIAFSGKNALSSKTITSLSFGHNNTILIGTQGGGFSVLKNNTDADNSENKESNTIGNFTIEHFNNENGLASDAIGGLYQSKNGDIWLSTAKGISRFKQESKTFHNYTIKEGVYSSYSVGRHFQDEIGTLYFSGSQGLTYFSPENIKDEKIAPEVILTDFLISNKSVNPSKNNTTPLHNSINHTSSIILSHQQNIFSFEFSSTNYSSPELRQYDYKMQGFDESWISTDANNRRATYTNLDAGNYTFIVKVKSTNNKQSQKLKKVKLTIMPAPWATHWAYASYLLIFLSLMLIFAKQRYKNIKAIKAHNKQLSITSKLFENTSEGVWLLDQNYCFIAVNTGFCSITGYDKNEKIGHEIQFSSTDKQSQEILNSIKERIVRGGRWEGVIWDKRKNGEIYPLEIVIDQIPLGDSELSHQYVGIFSDITHKFKHEQELKRLSLFDSLTGLANRANFESQVSTTIINNASQAMVMAYIDLDHFKKINDSGGHEVGDELLQILAKRLIAFSKNTMHIARLGGDEFALFSINKTKKLATSVYAANLAKQLLIIISEAVEISDHYITPTASVGITIFPDNGDAYQTLLRNAETAMYRAKSVEGNSYEFYQNEMSLATKERLLLENELNEAISNGEIKPYFQAKVNLTTGAIEGAEVLARWYNKRLGFISPDVFIGLAEETGSIIYLGEQLLTQACRDISPLLAQGLLTGKIAVNLSALQFKQDDLIQTIDKILATHKFPVDQLELEITESIVMDNVENAIRTMQQLSERGIHLAIDDFGTGYSSLNYLKKFSVNTLKIDRSFIVDIMTNSQDKKIVSAIIQLAHSLDLSVVAEGIETIEQALFLRELGCEAMQGFYYSKALPINEFTEFLQKEKNLFDGINS